MTWMHAPLLALLAVLLPAPSPPPQEAQELPPCLRLIDGGASIELQLDDVPLEQFIMAAQPVLGTPIHYEPADLASMRTHRPGVERVSRAAFRDAFDAILRRYDILTWDDTAGGATVVTLFRLTAGTGRSGGLRLPFSPPMLRPEELDSVSQPRFPFLTVAFPLQHVAARDMMMLLQSTLDSAIEIVRPIEATNQILVTASRDHMLAVRDMLRTIDVPQPGMAAPVQRLAALEQRVADLAARVAKLESANR